MASPEPGWRYPYAPTARQQALHQCKAQEILYGGSAGGGKSAAVLAAGVNLCMLIPGAKFLVLRRTYKQLEMEIIPRLRSTIPPEIARYNGGDHTFTFHHNGSVLRLGYLATDSDVYNYQGIELTGLAFDELTQFSRRQYVYMRSRLRMAGETADAMRERGWVPRIISTSNPGGTGHSWCKAMFVDPSPGPDITFWGGVQQGDDGAGKRWMAYIPARASDNPYLDLRAYRQQLAGLDPILRRALEEGDWDILEGTRFSQFRRATHVIDPEQLPISLVGYPRAMGVDYGLQAPFAALWGALLPDNLVVVYRELYGANLTAKQQAELILEAEAPDERAQYRPIPIALDPSCWIRASENVIKPIDASLPAVGSIAWHYRQVLGGAVHKARNDRVAGWQLVDEALRVQADGLPRLLIYSTCLNLIRTLPELARSLTNPEDVSGHPKQEDHVADALRMLLFELIGGGVQRVPPSSAGLGRLLGEEDPQYRADLQLDRIGAEPPSRHRPRLPAMQPAKRGSYTDS